jgi:hypothetical protein
MDMKKANLLFAVLLAPFTSTHAGIINTYYYLNHNLMMGGNPSQDIHLESGNDYNNTLTQSSWTCIPMGENSCLGVTTTATSTLVFHQDFDAGIISGSLAWDHSQSYYGEPNSWAGESLQLGYDLTSSYRYTIAVTGSATGTSQGPLSAQFWLGDTVLYESYIHGPLSFYEEGIFDGDNNSINPDLFFNLSAWACYYEGCSQVSSSGSLNFMVALTPVPLPTTAWLFVSSLIGLAGLARKRKAA